MGDERRVKGDEHWAMNYGQGRMNKGRRAMYYGLLAVGNGTIGNKQ